MKWLVAVLMMVAFAGCLTDDSTESTFGAPMDKSGAFQISSDGESMMVPGFQTSFNYSGHSGAEPNIGVTSSGAIFMTAFEETIRSRDGGQNWDVVQNFQMLDPVPTGIGTSDPMLWVDTTTDRVWVNHMYSTNCFNMLWSDDEGETWTQRDLACLIPSVDHQKVVAGPPGPGLNPFTTNMPLHSSVVYTCYNKYPVGGSDCFMSFDGGLTYPLETRAFDGSTACGGINGHPAFAPDGTIVLPAALYCGPEVAVSSDSGLTWTVRSGPTGATAGASVDPDVTFDEDGTMYLQWRNSDHYAQLAKSDDLGLTWEGPWNITHPGLTSTRFHVASAGDDGRVAMAYLGTSEPRETVWGDNVTWTGAPNDAPPTAQWHLYIVTLEDGVEPVFTSHQVTPDEDPVQIGCAWEGGGGGGARSCRNMLDFIDSVMGPEGEFYVTYTEGCTIRNGCAEAERPTDEMESRDREIAMATIDWSLRA